ncbi:unnamed protein product [Owenia fusiformis]|uniref:Ig-like domain-containing protein n=1 Tax=Owenia fusiformis TaxID=6347 RepID=A0A8S4Q8Y0_OWEFU|nr:unnamed protein product [Owenia fusiformis]
MNASKMHMEYTNWIFIILICLTKASGQSDIVLIEGPQDRAVLSGQNAELTCHIDTISSADHLVQWIGNSGEQISINDRVTTTNPHHKYSISTEKSYNLGLQNVVLDDAGKYTCNDVLTGTPIGDLEPHLVVLKPALCPMSGTTSFIQNNTITFEWSVTYAGERDDSEKPTITWTLNGIEQTATPDETTPGVLKSRYTKSASSVDNQKELYCSLSVLNIQQHCSTRLNIQYPARKPTLFVDGNNIPDQAILQRTVGTNVQLKGESLANPTPTYTWQFRTTYDPNFGTEEFGDTKQINNIQFNQAGIYRCCASNYLNGYRECSELTIEVVEGGNPGLISRILKL